MDVRNTKSQPPSTRRDVCGSTARGHGATARGRPGRAPTRGANRDDNQLMSRPPPGFGRVSGPPDCYSRLPDCRTRTWPDSDPEGELGLELVIDIVRPWWLGPLWTGPARDGALAAVAPASPVGRVWLEAGETAPVEDNMITGWGEGPGRRHHGLGPRARSSGTSGPRLPRGARVARIRLTGAASGDAVTLGAEQAAAFNGSRHGSSRPGGFSNCTAPSRLESTRGFSNWRRGSPRPPRGACAA